MTREEAIDVLKHNYPSACFTDLCEAVEIAIQALSSQPEIIRCKDCIYWDFSGYCVDFMTQDENGFCSWAERRTDE